MTPKSWKWTRSESAMAQQSAQDRYEPPHQLVGTEPRGCFEPPRRSCYVLLTWVSGQRMRSMPSLRTSPTGRVKWAIWVNCLGSHRGCRLLTFAAWILCDCTISIYQCLYFMTFHDHIASGVSAIFGGWCLLRPVPDSCATSQMVGTPSNKTKKYKLPWGTNRLWDRSFQDQLQPLASSMSCTLPHLRGIKNPNGNMNCGH